jgi:hypothetical protein
LSIAAKDRRRKTTRAVLKFVTCWTLRWIDLLAGSEFLASMHRWKGKKERFREHERTTCTWWLSCVLFVFMTTLSALYLSYVYFAKRCWMLFSLL